MGICPKDYWGCFKKRGFWPWPPKKGGFPKSEERGKWNKQLKPIVGKK